MMLRSDSIDRAEVEQKTIEEKAAKYREEQQKQLVKHKCKSCKGDGHKHVRCSMCDGTGSLFMYSCTTCKAKGYIIKYDEDCPDCGGEGYVWK